MATDLGTRKVVAVYYGMIAYADAQMSRVYNALEQRGMLDNTWFILGSDHGDYTGEKGLFAKSESLYECLLHVPFVIRAPEGADYPSGIQVNHIVNLVDLFPTILGMPGIEVPGYCQGHDLGPWIVSDAGSPLREAVYAQAGECHGHNGTLVVPTFDPATDPSEVGTITETVRRLPGCLRSLHLTHSVAAVGVHASEITQTHGASAFGDDGPLWRLQELDAIVCLLGVSYRRCTFFHVLEQLVQVEYREMHEVAASYRDDSGELRPSPTRVYAPVSDFEGNDFNKLGRILEVRGLVTIGAIGNAVTRYFRARDALETGVSEYRSDPALFLQADPFRSITTPG